MRPPSVHWLASFLPPSSLPDALPRVDVSASLGRVGLWEGALSLFYEMHERALPIDTHTYTAVAKALKDGRQWASAHKFLGTVATYGQNDMVS